VRFRPLLALFTLVLSLGCEREVKGPGTAPPVPVDESKPVDGGTLIRRLDVDVTTLNPILPSTRYDRLVAAYLFTPLVQLDRNLQPIPGLASSWDISDDGRLYRFQINDKATFSDGTPVRASDVLFTLKKIVDPSSEAVQIAGSFELLDMSRTRAVDDKTLEVGFREPLAMQLIRFNDVMVVPEHVYGKGNFSKDHNEKPVGSGPYTLARHDAGRELAFERRRDYWAERPHIQTVVFKLINDHSTAFHALQRGEIHETVIASDMWLRERNNPELAKTIDFQRFYSLNYNYIAWNTRNPLLTDKRVRRALSMCIPVENVINDLFHGTARAMSGPFTPDEWAYNPTVPVIRYDPDGARQLLAAAGWTDSNRDGVVDRNGRPFRLSLLQMTGSSTGRQFTQMVQSELKKVGVQLDLEMMDGSSAIQRILAGNYQAAYLSWDLDPDPDPHALFHSTQIPPRGQNFVFYSNPAADQLIDQGRRELDQSKRKEIYWKLHEVLAEDQPYTWVVQVSAKWGVNRRLRNVVPSRGLGFFLWYPGEFGWWIARGNAPAAPPPSAAR
jgi:peptide/nickel transport system substrate-binding protein